MNLDFFDFQIENLINPIHIIPTSMNNELTINEIFD